MKYLAFIWSLEGRKTQRVLLSTAHVCQVQTQRPSDRESAVSENQDLPETPGDWGRAQLEGGSKIHGIQKKMLIIVGRLVTVWSPSSLSNLIYFQLKKSDFSTVTPSPLHHQGPIEWIIHFTNVSNTGRRVCSAGELPGMKKKTSVASCCSLRFSEKWVLNRSVLEMRALWCHSRR